MAKRQPLLMTPVTTFHYDPRDLAYTHKHSLTPRLPSKLTDLDISLRDSAHLTTKHNLLDTYTGRLNRKRTQ